MPLPREVFDELRDESLRSSRWLSWRSAMLLPPYIVSLAPAHCTHVSAGMFNHTSHARCQKNNSRRVDEVGGAVRTCSA
jgi:hypothetical protein